MMNSDRIKEIQSETAFPNSKSVMTALTQVWNECEQENKAKVEELTYLVTELDAHEGAEGWSDYLENHLKTWRVKQEGE